MQDQKRAAPYDAEDEEELYQEMLSVASATECTGLIPASPVTEPQVDSYSEIYDIPLAGDAKDASHGFQDAGHPQKKPPLPPKRAN